MSKELKLLVQIKNRFVSVNSLYKSRIIYKGGKPVPSTYKNPKAVQIEREIREQLRDVDFSDYLEWFRNTPGFKLQIQFVFKRNITNSDTSNYVKSLEDILTRFIKEDLGIENYDDSRHIEVYSVKSIIPKSKHEYACISLSESKFNMRLDKEDKPKRFFLGGTTAGSTWRNEVIQELEKRKLEYFNPVVPDWNDEARKKEEEEKEKCDTMLFLITPEMQGVYSIAEIINSVWEVVTSGNGFVYFGVLEDGWDEARLRSLRATLDMVSEISQGSSRIKYGMVSKPVEILNL